jgi:uncharacterized membrane protein
MNEQRLVDKAIAKGQLTVNLPVAVIFISTMAGFLYFQRKLEYPEYFSLIGLFAGIILSSIFWSLSLTRWKVWAYANVNDIALLKKEAIKAKLTWPDSSIFNRTVIQSKRQMSLLIELENKKNTIPFPKIDLKNLPKTTVIKYPLGNTIFNLALPIFMTSVGIHLLLSGSNILGGIIVLFCLLRFYRTVKNLGNESRTTITLHEKGITIGKDRFDWNEITEIEATFGVAGREDQELKIKTLNNVFNLSIGDYNLPADEINERIYTYRNKAL